MATKERIYIDKEFVPLADRLVRRKIPGSESEEGVFRDTRELVAFAAGLGFKHKQKRDVLENGREIKLSVIDRITLGGVSLVQALSIAETGDIRILGKDKDVDRAEIFEKYVNGGLEYISGMAGEETALESIIGIIRSEYSPGEDRKAVIDLLSQKI